MFTGIITDLGKFKKRNGSAFFFEADREFVAKLEHGTSVAINGACMTVTDIPDTTNFSVDVMPESEQRTMFGLLNPEDIVNLELPATPETFLSGHIVQGHVDGIGEVLSVTDAGISKIVAINIPSELRKYIVDKGSICINGVSLTVIRVDDESCRVGIIPFTWEHTMLHTLEVGSKVNIETDVFARYVEQLLHTKE